MSLTWHWTVQIDRKIVINLSKLWLQRSFISCWWCFLLTKSYLWMLWLVFTSPLPVVYSCSSYICPRLWPPPISPISMFILQSSAVLLCNYSSLVAERNIFLPWCNSSGSGLGGPVNPSPWHLFDSPGTVSWARQPRCNDSSAKRLSGQSALVLSGRGDCVDGWWVQVCQICVRLTARSLFHKCC